VFFFVVVLPFFFVLPLAAKLVLALSIRVDRMERATCRGHLCKAALGFGFGFGFGFGLGLGLGLR